MCEDSVGGGFTVGEPLLPKRLLNQEPLLPPPGAAVALLEGTCKVGALDGGGVTVGACETSRLNDVVLGLTPPARATGCVL